jgi:hypothetical protein
MRAQVSIGVKGEATETVPGIFVDSYEEIDINAEIYVQPSRWLSAESNQDTVTSNVVIKVIVPDELIEKYMSASYIVFSGIKWSIQTYEPERPYIKFKLGGIYNG